MGKVLHPSLEKHLKEGTVLNDLAGKRVRWTRTLTCADGMKSDSMTWQYRQKTKPKVAYLEFWAMKGAT